MNRKNSRAMLNAAMNEKLVRAATGDIKESKRIQECALTRDEIKSYFYRIENKKGNK